MNIKTGTIIAENYRIEKSISENGGMASVFLATKISDPRMKLAVKFPHTVNGGPTHEDKLLERESDLLQRWDWRHPGVVRLYPIERNDRNPVYLLKAIELPNHPYFIMMEYLRGNSLGRNMNQIKNFPTEWKLELVYQICQSISFLHQKGYGHRDLKPENIVFRTPISPDQIPQPVLIDFALSCSDDEGSLIVEKSYTLEYASPERVLRSTGMVPDLPVNALKSDIWSLGVIFYEIMTGEHLFKGNERSVRTTLIEGAFHSKIQNISEMLPQLSAFVRGLLQGDPAKRPTIKEIIYAIEEMFPPPRIRAL